MIVNLAHKDLVNLLRGTSPEYEFMPTLEKLALGSFSDNRGWQWPLYWIGHEPWSNFSEQELFALYQAIALSGIVIEGQ